MPTPLKGLLALREQLRTSDNLTLWFEDTYQKPARFFVGNKEAPNANDYPFVCVVPNLARRGKLSGDLEAVSIIIGVNDKEITDDVFNGVSNMAIAETLVIEALNADWTGGVTWTGVVDVITDLGKGHPFYKTELQLNLKVM